MFRRSSHRSGLWALALSVVLVAAERAASEPAIAEARASQGIGRGSLDAGLGWEDSAASCSTPRHLLPIWRFHAGAPLPAAPTPLPDGGLGFGTDEGYVHALGPEGEFRWSYTLDGPVTGRVAALPTTGDVVAATLTGSVYRLRGDGRGLLRFRVPSPPVTGLVAVGGRIWYGAKDDHLYAITGRGRIVLRLAAGGALSADPVAGGPNRVLFGTLDGGVVAVRGLHDSQRAQLDGAILDPPLPWRGGGSLVRSGRSLVALAPELGVRWRLPNVDTVGASEAVLVTSTGRDLSWHSPDGRVVRTVKLPEPLSAPPLVLQRGVAVVTDAARVAVLEQTGCVAAVAALPRKGFGWLLGGGDRVVAAAGDGSIVALELRAARAE